MNLCLVAAVAVLAWTGVSSAQEFRLVGVPWEVETLQGSPVTISPPSTLVVGQDGVVNGNAGCNSFAGMASIDGRALKFEQMRATLMACEYSDVERVYLDALAVVASYEIAGDKLSLSDAAGDVVATFVPQYVQ